MVRKTAHCADPVSVVPSAVALVSCQLAILEKWTDWPSPALRVRRTPDPDSQYTRVLCLSQWEKPTARPPIALCGSSLRPGAATQLWQRARPGFQNTRAAIPVRLGPRQSGQTDNYRTLPPSVIAAKQD